MGMIWKVLEENADYFILLLLYISHHNHTLIFYSNFHESEVLFYSLLDGVTRGKERDFTICSVQSCSKKGRMKVKLFMCERMDGYSSCNLQLKHVNSFIDYIKVAEEWRFIIRERFRNSKSFIAIIVKNSSKYSLKTNNLYQTTEYRQYKTC